MKHLFLILSVLFTFTTHLLFAQIATLTSPDGKLKLMLYLEEGRPQYTVAYAGKCILEKSPLGIITNEGDFSLIGGKELHPGENQAVGRPL